jgi:hypothetical protein
MNTVKIQPSASGSLVSAFKKNGGKNGYVHLVQTTTEIDNGWLREKKRSALLKGDVKLLTAMVASAKNGELPGRICVQEWVESELPEAVKSRLVGKDQDYDDAIDGFIKRAGEDGPELTCGGERIVRYAFYDPTMSATDSKVAHDNGDEVKEWKAEQAKAEAGLPAGK